MVGAEARRNVLIRFHTIKRDSKDKYVYKVDTAAQQKSKGICLYKLLITYTGLKNVGAQC